MNSGGWRDTNIQSLINVIQDKVEEATRPRLGGLVAYIDCLEKMIFKLMLKMKRKATVVTD